MSNQQQDDLKVHTNADMSHQNSLLYKLSMFWDSIKLNGPIETLERLLLRAYYRYKGIDFSTQNLHNLTLTGDYTDHGTALVSSSRHFFKRILAELEQFAGHQVSKKLFIDYGSGKGAALIHARALGFERAIGIEFAKELNDVAIDNIRKLGLDHIDAYFRDATEYTPPKETTVIYFFNPFDEVVMEKVMQNISQQVYTTTPYIIYGRPTCGHVVEQYATKIGTSTHESGAVIDFYQLSKDH